MRVEDRFTYACIYAQQPRERVNNAPVMDMNFSAVTPVLSSRRNRIGLQVHDYKEDSEIPEIINAWFEKRFPTRRRDGSRDSRGLRTERGRRTSSRDRGGTVDSKRSVVVGKVGHLLGRAMFAFDFMSHL